MPNPTISTITLPTGSTYDIKDAWARDAISELSGATKYIGVTTTALTDGCTTNPITINGQSVTAESGDIANYGSKEFIFNGTAWQEFGDLSQLGDLAFKDNASGSYTPAGSISVTPTVTVNTTTVNSITNVGTLPTCTLPALSTTVSNENLTIGWSEGSFSAGTLPTKGSNTTVATGIDSATATGSFTGTAATITVS